MADLKFTDLTAGSTGIDNSSLVCFSEYDGVSAYTSKKYTISTMRDILNVWEAEDKITFDSTGTNKVFADDSNTTVDIRINDNTDNDFTVTTDNGAYVTPYTIIGKTSGQDIYSNDFGIGLYDATDAFVFTHNGTFTGMSAGRFFEVLNNRGSNVTGDNVDQLCSAISARNATFNSNVTNALIAGGVGVTADKDDYLFSGKHELQLGTETVSIEDAGSVSATEQDWIEVSVGGVTGYIRVFATK